MDKVARQFIVKPTWPCSGMRYKASAEEAEMAGYLVGRNSGGRTALNGISLLYNIAPLLWLPSTCCGCSIGIHRLQSIQTPIHWGFYIGLFVLVVLVAVHVYSNRKREAEVALSTKRLKEEIAERKRAENALHEERNKLRSIVDAMDGMDGMLTIQDAEFNIIYQNGLMARTFGGLGEKCYKVYEGKDDVCDDCPVEKAFQDGQSHISEREVTVLGEEAVYFENSSHPVKDSTGKITSCVEVVRNTTARKWSEKARDLAHKRQQRLNELQRKLLAPGDLHLKLKQITDGVVDIFNADFCRIWVVGPGDLCDSGCPHAQCAEEPSACRQRDVCLKLVASSGRYTQIDGEQHSRVPFGFCKIGKLAAGQERKLVTNDVRNDCQIHDNEWARELGLISFAGYQLRPIDGQTIGILALFAKHAIYSDEDAALESVGSAAAQVIQRARAEEELDRTHRELLKVSRRAGMSEIATGVLHNVGNILNSVNVSAEIVAGKVRNSRVMELRKAGDIVSQHADNIVEFVANHPQGKHLAKYFVEIGKHLAAERDIILADLATLRESIEHIKDIVSRQQSYARVSGMLEELDPKELIEDALRIRAVSFGRHHIEVVREYDEHVPNVLADRHKIMQIIVNMVGNAKHAISDHRSTGGTLTLRLHSPDEHHIKFEVTDDGVGIAEENLSKVFNYGFTTKKEGHGFGLHSSALAAAEMGGSVTVESNGVGKGATFSLELPTKPPDDLVENDHNEREAEASRPAASVSAGTLNQDVEESWNV